MYVMMNRLTVTPENAGHLEQGFAHSAGRMREVPGCGDFHLLKETGTEGAAVYMVLTEWADEASFRAWTESDAFRRAHANAGDTGAMGDVHMYTAIF
ncbi:MAG: antibiotic biosynthesis monooxygenase family protein [Thermomicrobiales bacterium]